MGCNTHTEHDHKHGANCGHEAVQHEGHTDYLHDGHMHHMHGEHADEHVVAESKKNVSSCAPEHKCHDVQHRHNSSCGHQQVPHGNHVDYLVEGHLHSPCQDHCDDHGKME